MLSIGASFLWKKQTNEVKIKQQQNFQSILSMLKLFFCLFFSFQPERDLSIENLKYLSSEQALADLAYFIESKNVEYKFDAAKVKWIAFGGSYPGSLAAWVREKYPQLVYGSVSTSGPVLAKADFYGMCSIQKFVDEIRFFLICSFLFNFYQNIMMW